MSFNAENSWKNAVKLTLPILMGYLAAGIAYGILATSTGLPAWFTIVMSFTVFSGTAQYAAIPFFISGVGIIPIFLSTLLMSLRFMFYTLNMYSLLPKERVKRFLSTCYLTDESFALLTTFPANTRQAMMLKVNFLGMIYWVIATIIGIALGDSVSQYIPNLDFALPCLFAILAYEQYKSQKQWKSIFIALVGFLLARQITDQSVLLVAILIAIVIVTLLPQSFFDHKKGKA
ncbi:AzlC family ABC transporter permease [Ursidibacter maritimus]|uniref:AzlC family ABC transporter permease n=1 Tax=Ursidibacter maritimus TaxID=1331689 RepID=A0A949T9U4_9PAST|nr:AzlC family ABC transporter permease [Ursidibacter maritimus]KAE9541487.1 branched-chain amino acid permease [Ursidibacter maritimus]MBV6524843.1 AzlC family ABC transporter permease [Ursidibacter maritimus]MBV6526750.1 AzlC family ABC transporter permease [Ursidibacter maritimus]MBV6528601.1 AzlC family ABC transporter permease [Ursidibacter maritimus]MBV6530453.1 AzlC family ABC transporter permease [Ursidibacter maritimus]